MLFSLAGDLPWSRLVGVYRQWASTQKMPLRTNEALRRRLHQNGYSCKSFGEYLSPSAVASMIGIDVWSVRYWIRKGWLPAHREGTQFYVSRTELRRLARTRPKLFICKSEADLMQLLCDRELSASIIRTQSKVRTGKPQRIRCLTNRQVYPSVTAAAAAVFVNRESISKAIRRNGRCAGHRWEYVI